MDVKRDSILQAYLFLKSYAYHDNLNLFLKERVAEFESDDFEEHVTELHRVLSNDSPSKTPEFANWLSKIGYHLLPKSVERSKQTDGEVGLFLSNVRSAESYSTERVNYLISAPTELHIIEMMWASIVGPLLELDLTKDCYGNRLSDQAIRFIDSSEGACKNHHPGEVFKRYIEQYNSWRDLAISCATETASSGDDVAILSIDLQSFFYNIDLNFDDVTKAIDDRADEGIADTAHALTTLLKEIYSRFQSKVKPRLEATHPHCKASGLPIGFASSSVLANWYLRGFDEAITDEVRPAYYGRYVDDILLVFKRPKLDANSPIRGFISRYLSKLLIEDNGNYLLISADKKLPVQHEKLILHYFDKEHSLAGLEVFKKELDERSSAFKFLPDEHIKSDLNKFAYDVLYDGSANKLRSIVGLAENETELARFLSSHTIAHRLCKLDQTDQVLQQIKLFFRGTNALQFSRLWEKVYQYAVILNRQDFVIDFFNNIEEEIDRLSLDSAEPSHTRNPKLLSLMLRRDLKEYNRLALSLCVGLLSVEVYERDLEELLDIPLDDLQTQFRSNALQSFAVSKNISKKVVVLRQANIIRHHLVAWPLVNFTNFKGNLTDEKACREAVNSQVEASRISLSPRFIHLDEWQLHSLNSALLSGESLPSWQENSVEIYAGLDLWNEAPVDYKYEPSGGVNVGSFRIGNGSNEGSLRVGIANMKLSEADIVAAVRKDKSPNVSFGRQSKLYGMLNSAEAEDVDLLILPEVSVPVSWLPFMVAYARQHQMGLIFGLEHWIVGDVAYNLIIEALPFKTSGKYKSCSLTARLKNHYAPKELEMLESFRLTPATDLAPSPAYHKTTWNGACFSTYNCFELSDIHHRALFKAELDMLIACVWNKDTNYYQHILESVVRDLHCYVVQSNTSQFGGSCVLRPTKTETKTKLYVKGGENSCVLTTKLDIKELREFQFKSKKGPADKFKPLPPGYDSAAVMHR